MLSSCCSVAIVMTNAGVTCICENMLENKNLTSVINSIKDMSLQELF